MLFDKVLTPEFLFLYDLGFEIKTKIMDLKREAKEAGVTIAELWAAKKGLQWTGSLLKWGAIIGAGYLGYKYFKNNEACIRDKWNDTVN